MRYSASFFAILLYFLNPSSQVLAEQLSEHETPQIKAQRHPDAPERGSDEFEAARAQIKKMVDSVDGNSISPENNLNQENSLLRPRTELAEEIVKSLLASLDKGKAEQAIFDFLVGNESYTEQDHKDIFVTQTGEDLLAKIKDKKEKVFAIYEYTRARQLLRQKLFKEIQDKLSRTSDPRALLLAEAIRQTVPASQLSYEEAIEKIKKESLDRPICFSCGEPVSLKQDYDFYNQMGEVAKVVANNLHLVPKEKGGEVPSPFFDADQKFFTFDGKTMYELEDKNSKRHQIGVSKGTVTYAIDNESPRSLNSSNPVQKKLNQLRMDFINSGGKPKAFSNQGQASVNSTKGTNSNTGRNIVSDFVKNNRGKDLAATYPKADDMARALGLVDSAGASLLIHKDAHWDGTKEYGVHIRWDLIENAPSEEKAKILNILSTVRDGSIKDWKIVNGKKGYCLWCNLNNDLTSIRKLRELSGN